MIPYLFCSNRVVACSHAFERMFEKGNVLRYETCVFKLAEESVTAMSRYAYQEWCKIERQGEQWRVEVVGLDCSRIL